MLDPAHFPNAQSHQRALGSVWGFVLDHRHNNDEREHHFYWHGRGVPSFNLHYGCYLDKEGFDQSLEHHGHDHELEHKDEHDEVVLRRKKRSG